MSLHHNPRIVTLGLVLALDAGDTNSYPGSGTNIYDLSGRGNSSTLNNGAAYSTNYKGVFSFDGSNDFLNTGSGADTTFSHTTGWTVQFSFNPVTFTNTYPGILLKGTASSTGVLLFYGNTGILYWKHNNVQTNLVDMDFNTWYNIAITYSGTGNVLGYVNGVYIKTLGSMASTNSSSNLLLGQGDQHGNNLLGPFLKYNRALTASEIEANYNAIKGRFNI